MRSDRSPATLPTLKASQDNRVPAGFKYVPPIPVRRKGCSFVARHRFLKQCPGSRNRIEIVFAFDETKFLLRL
jgi:hypothetical protein